MYKKIIAGCWIASILATIYFVKFYWPNTEYISITKPHVGPTIVNKSEDKTCEDCRNSSLGMKAQVKENEVYGQIFDDCKSADFSFKIKTRPKKKHIFGIEYMFLYNRENLWGAYYLYDMNLIQLGGGVLVAKNNIGFSLKAQRAF